MSVGDSSQFGYFRQGGASPGFGIGDDSEGGEAFALGGDVLAGCGALVLADLKPGHAEKSPDLTCATRVRIQVQGDHVHERVLELTSTTPAPPTAPPRPSTDASATRPSGSATSPATSPEHYVARRTTEGKTTREIRHMLNRYIT